MLVLTEDQEIGTVVLLEYGMVFAIFTLERLDGSLYYGEKVFLRSEVTLVPEGREKDPR